MVITGFLIGFGVGLLAPLIWQNRSSIVSKIKEFFGQKFD
jgi:membrane-associated phospholipid phosphatase